MFGVLTLEQHRHKHRRQHQQHHQHHLVLTHHPPTTTAKTKARYIENNTFIADHIAALMEVDAVCNDLGLPHPSEASPNARGNIIATLDDDSDRRLSPTEWKKVRVNLCLVACFRPYCLKFFHLHFWRFFWHTYNYYLFSARGN